MTTHNVPADVLDKIAGLLQLAEKNDNLNESATASAAAQKLLTKWRLTRADLSEHDTDKGEQPETAADPLIVGNRISNWKKELIRGIVYSNGCRFYYSRQYAGTGHGGTYRSRREYNINVKLVGMPSDIEIVRYFYSYLSGEIERLFEAARARGEIRGKTGGTSFKLGAANAIASRLSAAHSEQKAEAKRAAESGGSQAIVRLDAAEAEVEEYYSTISRGFSKAQKQAQIQVDYNAYSKGMKAGASVGLHKGLTGGRAATKMLGS